MNHYDIIIAGGGIAGLSLAYHLAHSPLQGQRMLIIDRDSKLRNDRTLSFWSKQPTLFDPLICHSWQQLRVATGAFEQVTPLSTYRYATIKGIDFYQHVRAALGNDPTVSFLQGNITAVEDLPEGGRVWVEGEPYCGTWIFDSRFNGADFHPDLSRYHALEQHFYGWVIETDHPAFDPHTATLMDFRTEQKEEMRFFYVLPFSDHQALVEYVLASQDHCRPAMQTYLEQVLGLKNYRVLNQEGGVSPLSDYPFPRQLGAHHMAIGTLGGQVKPSSGYAFTRIEQDSTAIVNSLLKHGHPFETPASPTRYRIYDRLMLDVMQHHGGAILPIFEAMFKHNPLERVFHLLDETATPQEMFWLTISVPPRHFLQAILHSLFLNRD